MFIIPHHPQVRKETVQSITFPPGGSSSTSQWKLQPEVKTVEPMNTHYFSCPPEIVVPANGTVAIDLVYKPLTTTKEFENKEDGSMKMLTHKVGEQGRRC